MSFKLMVLQLIKQQQFLHFLLDGPKISYISCNTFYGRYQVQWDYIFLMQQIICFFHISCTGNLLLNICQSSLTYVQKQSRNTFMDGKQKEVGLNYFIKPLLMKFKGIVFLSVQPLFQQLFYVQELFQNLLFLIYLTQM